MILTVFAEQCLRSLYPAKTDGAIDGARTHDPLDHNQML